MKEYNFPLVSVVIPTYNRIKTLPISVESVLNQTYRHLELLIMDDGSTDGTAEYVAGLGDSRVRYRRSEENLGPSAARNMGAQLAQGEFLAFQDSDDEWRPDKLEKQMELLLGQQDLSMVYCEFGVYQKEEFLGIIPSRKVPFENKNGDLFSYLLLYPLISTQTMVLNRKEFLRIGGFNEELKAYEDFEFSLRFSEQHRIGFLEETLVKMNSLPNSVSKRYGERICTQFYMARRYMDVLREKGLLWDKLEIIMCEAENLKCHDVFIEEMKKLFEAFRPGEEQESAAACLDRIEKSKENYLAKVHIYESLPKFKQKVLQIYLELYEGRTSWSETLKAVLKEILQGVDVYGQVFRIPQETGQKKYAIERRIDGEVMQDTDQLYLLADLVELLELLEIQIKKQL